MSILLVDSHLVEFQINLPLEVSAIHLHNRSYNGKWVRRAMTLICEIFKRYPKYGPLNKFFIWCGILGVAGFIYTIVAPFLRPPTANFNWPEVFQELERRERQSQQLPLLTRTFWLLKEPGASISLGPCPGDKCLTFRLGELETEENILVQRVYVQGGGFQIKSRAAGTSKYLVEMNNMIQVSGSALTLPFDGTDPWISLALRKGAYFRMFLKKVADIELKVLDTKTDSLRLQLQVSPPTNKMLVPNPDKPVP